MAFHRAGYGYLARGRGCCAGGADPDLYGVGRTSVSIAWRGRGGVGVMAGFNYALYDFVWAHPFNRCAVAVGVLVFYPCYF